MNVVVQSNISPPSKNFIIIFTTRQGVRIVKFRIAIQDIAFFFYQCNSKCVIYFGFTQPTPFYRDEL